MLATHPQRRLHVLETPGDAHGREFAQAVLAGLTASPKRLPFRYLYDAEGSRLFELITAQPEYYLTRAEDEILRRHADDIVARMPSPAAVVELGSGSSSKTRALLDAWFRLHRFLRYVPIDISRAALRQSADELLVEYPRLEITAIASEYQEGLSQVAALNLHPQCVLWLGSNMGNLTRTEAAAFLGGMHGNFHHGDRLLVGVDTCRDAEVLERAYDDRKGVTAAFNLNLLERLNRELGGNFDPEEFKHQAEFNEDQDRVELSLVSLSRQRVVLAELGVEVEFEAGEPILTEYSYKYSPSAFEKVVQAAGFRVVEQWLDGSRRMSLNLLEPTGV